MSYYEFPTSTTLGGKYITNWTSGYNPQKYRWKRWSNATGYTMFIPENSSSERASVHNYLQNVSGVSRTVGVFGAADGRTIVTSIPATSSGPCWSGTGGTDPGAASACAGGTTDRFGSLWRVNAESLSESQDNPYYNTAADAKGAAESWYLTFRYSNSSGGSEDIWDYNISWCSNPSFPYRSYQVRQCFISSDRGRCWDQCGNNIPSVVEVLVVGGGGGGAGSSRETLYEEGDLIYDRSNLGGAGGAGGYRTSNVFVEASITCTVTVGAGGAATGGLGPTAFNGGTSSFTNGLTSVPATTISSTGGGAGGWGAPGTNGGSGGGGAVRFYTGNSPADVVYNAGSGNTPSTSPSQGNSGGTGSNFPWQYSGGGGGAGAAGSGPNGGNGSSSSISGSVVIRAGGGAGANSPAPSVGIAGTGGGGSSPVASAGTNGTTNLGGGGGAGGKYNTLGPVYYNGGSGGSGVIILRYPNFLSNATSTTGSPTFTNSGGYKVYTFTGSGTIMWRDTIA